MNKNVEEMRNVGLFTLISCLYSWPIFFVIDAWLVPMFIRQGDVAAARLTSLSGHMLAMAGPTLAAIFMWRGRHKESPPTWRWSQPGYYGLVVVAMFVLWTVPGLIGLAFGDKIVSSIETHIWVMVGLMLALGWFTGTGEEIGWCAYLLSRLAPRVGKARALIISGIIRGLWHWPVLVGPSFAQVFRGERTLVTLVGPSLTIAFLLALSNIFFGAVPGWVWYRTKSIALVGWLHQWHDLARDVTILLLVGYGSWSSTLGLVFQMTGLLLLILIGREGRRSDHSQLV
ncbi:MAG: CPBP family intramembrane metalloprotease [Anaerolineae bacterium]|nr:CPBP family intramembrane metalloprotease [Anaerolineae bacterium]